MYKRIDPFRGLKQPESIKPYLPETTIPDAAYLDLRFELISAKIIYSAENHPITNTCGTATVNTAGRNKGNTKKAEVYTSAGHGVGGCPKVTCRRKGREGIAKVPKSQTRNLEGTEEDHLSQFNPSVVGNREAVSDYITRGPAVLGSDVAICKGNVDSVRKCLPL